LKFCRILIQILIGKKRIIILWPKGVTDCYYLLLSIIHCHEIPFVVRHLVVIIKKI